MSDGSLIFDTKIDTTGAENGITKLRIKLSKATIDVQKQTAEVQRLENEMRKLQTTQVPTDQYAQLRAAMEKVDSQLMRLIDRQDKYLATGGKTKGVQWERLQYDIEAVAAKVREYQSQMERMRVDGSAFTKDSAALSEVTAKLDTAKTKLDELKLKEQEAGSKLKQAMTPTKEISPVLNAASEAMGRFGTRLAGVVRSALVFTVITQLLAKLRKYVAEASKSNAELRYELGRVKGALQSAFTPIFTAILPALTQLTSALATAIAYIGKFISMLFGGGTKKAASATAKLKGATVSLFGTTTDATKALNSETESISALGDASKDTAKSMAAFDEINQLDDKTTSGSGGSVGGGSGKSDDEILAISTDVTLPSWLTDGIGKLSTAIANLKTAAENLWNSKGFQALVEVVKWVAAATASVALSAFASAIQVIADVIQILADILNGDWSKAWEDTKKLIKDVWDWLQKLWMFLNMPFVLAMDKFFNDWLPAIEQWWNTSVKPWFSTEKWAELWDEVKLAWATKWAEIKAWWQNTTLVQWWSENVAPWFTKARWVQLWDDVKDAWTAKWNEIKTWWANTAIVNWWNNDVAPWFTTAKWRAVAAGMKDGLVQKWADVTTWWSGTALANWWTNDVMPWFTKDKWVGIMGGIKDGFEAAFDSAVNTAKDILNRFITKVNSFFHISFPGLSVGGKELVPAFESQLIRIPYLAQGAVIPPNHQFLAVLGDQTSGTNVEAPLSTIQQAVLEALAQTGGGSRDITVILELDHTEFGRAVYRANNDETQRVGLRLAGVHG